MLYVIRAVREREEFVKEILEQIPEAVVYYDDKFHNAFKSYLYVCEHIIKGQPAVLLEDDVILTYNFKEKAERVIDIFPDTLIKFFSLSKKNTKPYWEKGRNYCSSCCEYFPKGFSLKVVKAYESWPDKYKHPTAYDYLVGYTWGNNKEFLVWNPSLVQHRVAKSIINPKRSSKRQSITFIE